MKLRYINIGLDYDTFVKKDNKLRYQFQLHTRYISNYFSKLIRKYKIETEGEYDMISISLLEADQIKPSIIKSNGVLAVYLTFDEYKYKEAVKTDDPSYYLELFEEGFKKAAEFRNIQINLLLSLIKDFKNGGYKNEWTHKKKRFIETDIEVILKCEFTSNYFQLLAIVNEISTKKILTKGIAIKTEPDEVLFDKMFKDILVEDNQIIITNASDSPQVLINLTDAKNGTFNKIFAPYIYSDDYSEEENEKFKKTHNDVIKILSYDGSGF